MKWIAAALALGLTACAPALAQAPEQTPTAMAVRMIEAADAADVFEAIPGDRIMVRHRASRLTCRFTGLEETSQIVIFPGLPRGQDVGCNTHDAGRSATLYATRYPEAVTLEVLLHDAVAAIQQRYPDAERAPNQLDTLLNSQSPARTEAFFVNVRGQRYYSSVSVALVNGWAIKLRYSEPAPDEQSARRAELAARTLFALTLADSFPDL